MRKIDVVTHENKTARIYRDTVTHEYVVRLSVDGIYQPKADYFTDDKGDAIATAHYMVGDK